MSVLWSRVLVGVLCDEGKMKAERESLGDELGCQRAV